MRLPYKLLAVAPALLAACNLILQNDAAHRADEADASLSPRPDTGPVAPGEDGGADPDGGVPIEASTPDAAPFDASAAPYRRVLFYGQGDVDGTIRHDIWTTKENAADQGWERLGIEPGFVPSGGPFTTDEQHVFAVAEKGFAVSPLTGGIPGPADVVASLPTGSAMPCTTRIAPGSLHLGCAGRPHLIAAITLNADEPSFAPIFTDPNSGPVEDMRTGLFIQPTPAGFFGYDSKGDGYEWSVASGLYATRPRNGLPAGAQACSALVNGIVYVIFPDNGSGFNPEYYSEPSTADWGYLPPSLAPKFVGAPLTCAASNRALYVSGPSTDGSIVAHQAIAVSYVQANGTLSAWTNLTAPDGLAAIGQPVGLVTTALPGSP